MSLDNNCISIHEWGTCSAFFIVFLKIYDDKKVILKRQVKPKIEYINIISMLSTNFESYFSSTLLKKSRFVSFSCKCILARFFINFHRPINCTLLVTFNDPSKINGLSECGREGYSSKCFVIQKICLLAVEFRTTFTLPFQ